MKEPKQPLQTQTHGQDRHTDKTDKRTRQTHGQDRQKDKTDTRKRQTHGLDRHTDKSDDTYVFLFQIEDREASHI